jgi:hypothetical protein
LGAIEFKEELPIPIEEFRTLRQFLVGKLIWIRELGEEDADDERDEEERCDEYPQKDVA